LLTAAAGSEPAFADVIDDVDDDDDVVRDDGDDVSQRSMSTSAYCANNDTPYLYTNSQAETVTNKLYELRQANHQKKRQIRDKWFYQLPHSTKNCFTVATSSGEQKMSPRRQQQLPTETSSNQ